LNFISYFSSLSDRELNLKRREKVSGHKIQFTKKENFLRVIIVTIPKTAATAQ